MYPHVTKEASSLRVSSKQRAAQCISEMTLDHFQVLCSQFIRRDIGIIPLPGFSRKNPVVCHIWFELAVIYPLSSLF